MAKPTAIITSLEDCPEWLDRELAKAYWEADYFLPAPQLSDAESWLLRLDRPTPWLAPGLKAIGVQRFAIITAFNPKSVLLSLEENHARNARLHGNLLPYARTLHWSRSQSRDGQWVEDGFWALDIDLAIAAEMGRTFGQQSIVCWEEGQLPALWWL